MLNALICNTKPHKVVGCDVFCTTTKKMYVNWLSPAVATSWHLQITCVKHIHTGLIHLPDPATLQKKGCVVSVSYFVHVSFDVSIRQLRLAPTCCSICLVLVITFCVIFPLYTDKYNWSSVIFCDEV